MLRTVEILLGQHSVEHSRLIHVGVAPEPAIRLGGRFTHEGGRLLAERELQQGGTGVAVADGAENLADPSLVLRCELGKGHGQRGHGLTADLPEEFGGRPTAFLVLPRGHLPQQRRNGVLPGRDQSTPCEHLVTTGAVEHGDGFCDPRLIPGQSQVAAFNAIRQGADGLGQPRYPRRPLHGPIEPFGGHGGRGEHRGQRFVGAVVIQQPVGVRLGQFGVRDQRVVHEVHQMLFTHLSGRVVGVRGRRRKAHDGEHGGKQGHGPAKRLDDGHRAILQVALPDLGNGTARRPKSARRGSRRPRIASGQWGVNERTPTPNKPASPWYSSPRSGPSDVHAEEGTGREVR